MVRLPRRGSPDSIYRSERGGRRIRQLYRDWIESFDHPVERRWVETDHGATHCLVAGDEQAPPVVVLHGGNAINPLTFEWFLQLADSYRLYAPDIIGQPGFSAEVRLSPDGDAYPRWLAAVLDGLDLDCPAVIGVSFGAGLALRMASHRPARIDRAALIVPSGFGTASLVRRLAELYFPMLRYAAIPSIDHRDGAIEAMATVPADEIDDRLLTMIEAVFEGVRPMTRLPPAATAEELTGFDAPVLVAAATDDPLFPADVVLPRARAIVPNLEVVMRLEGERHLPSPAAQGAVRRYLRAFLDDA